MQPRPVLRGGSHQKGEFASYYPDRMKEGDLVRVRFSLEGCLMHDLT